MLKSELLTKHKAMYSVFGLSIKTLLFIKSQIESASHRKGNAVSQLVHKSEANRVQYFY